MTTAEESGREMSGMAVTVRGEGPNVVLLHGLMGSGADWDEVAGRLEGARRVIVPDLVGFGASRRSADVEELWADAQATTLARELDALGVRAATVAGHDFGGPVAVSLWRQRPDLIGRLALCATNLFDDTPIPLPISAVTWPLVGGMAERLLFSRPMLALTMRQGVGRPRVDLDPDTALGDGEQVRAIRTVFAHALRELAPRYAPLRAALETVDVPALVAWGGRDPFFDVAQGERTAAAIAGARLVVYGEAGHFLPRERPVELADELLALSREPVAAPS